MNDEILGEKSEAGAGPSPRSPCALTVHGHQSTGVLTLARLQPALSREMWRQEMTGFYSNKHLFHTCCVPGALFGTGAKM